MPKKEKKDDEEEEEEEEVTPPKLILETYDPANNFTFVKKVTLTEGG